MGVIPGDAIFQPQDVCYAEIISKKFLVIAFCKAWIALLNSALQAFFSGEKCAEPVDVDRATLENDAPAVVCWLEDFATEGSVGARDNLRVLLVVRVFRPTIEEKMIEGDLARIISDAYGA